MIDFDVEGKIFESEEAFGFISGVSDSISYSATYSGIRIDATPSSKHVKPPRYTLSQQLRVGWVASLGLVTDA